MEKRLGELVNLRIIMCDVAVKKEKIIQDVVASKYFQQGEGIVVTMGVIIQKTGEPFAYHHLHGLRLTHVGKEQRKNIMWENRVFSHSKLMVFGLSSSRKHRVTVWLYSCCMLVMVKDSTRDGDEQFRQKNNMGTRRKEKINWQVQIF